MNTVSISLPPFLPQTPLMSPSQIHSIFYYCYYCYYMSIHIHTYAHMFIQLTESLYHCLHVHVSGVDHLGLDNTSGAPVP